MEHEAGGAQRGAPRVSERSASESVGRAESRISSMTCASTLRLASKPRNLSASSIWWRALMTATSSKGGFPWSSRIADLLAGRVFDGVLAKTAHRLNWGNEEVLTFEQLAGRHHETPQRLLQARRSTGLARASRLTRGPSPAGWNRLEVAEVYLAEHVVRQGDLNVVALDRLSPVKR